MWTLPHVPFFLLILPQFTRLLLFTFISYQFNYFWHFLILPLSALLVLTPFYPLSILPLFTFFLCSFFLVYLILPCAFYLLLSCIFQTLSTHIYFTPFVLFTPLPILPPSYYIQFTSFPFFGFIFSLSEHFTPLSHLQKTSQKLKPP